MGTVQTLRKNRWLLALCGGLYLIVSLIFVFIIRGMDGPMTFHAWNGTMLFLGKVQILTGACLIATGIWRSAAGKCWLLVVNGVALCVLGLLYHGAFGGRISFRAIALLIAAMALSTCILQLRTPAARSLNGLGGAVSIAFALVFLGFVFHWIRLNPGSPAQSLVWLGSYFGFTAICLFAFAWSLRESVVK